jgi:beta-lactamase class A
MKSTRNTFAALTALLLMIPAIASDSLAGFAAAKTSPALQAVLDRTVATTLAKSWTPSLATNHVAITVVDLATPGAPVFASYRGDVPIYPASVIKLFYLAAAHRWMEDGKLPDTPELRRAMRDMIVESYNEPSHYIIDLLTGTTSGPELSAEEIKVWWDKRNAVNRWFASLGYPPTINVSKKPWCEGPYGRETQAIEAFEPKRNFLTTEATARLMTEIALGKCVSPERSRQMLELMARDFTSVATDPKDQAHDFTGIALKRGMKLWSKCGQTSQTRHDTALVELPGGRRLVIVTFTTDHAEEREIIPGIAGELIANLPK